MTLAHWHACETHDPLQHVLFAPPKQLCPLAPHGMQTPELGSQASPEQQSLVVAQQSPVWLHWPPLLLPLLPPDEPSIASERPASPLPLPLLPPIRS